MTQQEIKENFSKNLNILRKSKNLTQAKLAEMLNYSDKAVSKWEVGAVLPDVETLVHIADFFEITVNDLIYKKQVKAEKTSKVSHLLVTLLSCGLVWFIATFIYFILFQTVIDGKIWLSFVVALPVTFIVLVVFTTLWFKKIWQCLAVSGLVWSIIGMFYAIFNGLNLWFIFIVGAVAQLLVILWYLLKIHLLIFKSKS